MNHNLFGTDGIRGVSNQDFTPDFILNFAIALGAFFIKKGAKRVIIGKDTRLSCYMFESSLAAGFTSVGLDVFFLGPIPTPAVSILVKSLRADFGVMISASHNKYTDNGVKIFDHIGYKLTLENELEISKIMLEGNLSQYYCSPSEIGKIRHVPDAQGRYIEHLKSSIVKNIDLSGMRIVIDSANGACYKVATEVFWELGAQVQEIAGTPNGLNINSNCGSTYPQNLSNTIKNMGCDQIHIGFAFDGDGDRIVVVDENGDIISGDHLIGAIAFYMHSHYLLRNNMIATTYMSNMGLDCFLNKYNINVMRTNIGDKHVFAALKQHGGNFGGEQSGHLIFPDHSTAGDGLVVALYILQIMKTSQIKASKYFRQFELWPQITSSIHYNEHNPLDDATLLRKLNNLQSDSKYNILVRKSGTEKLIRVMVQSQDQQAAQKMHDDIYSELACVIG